MIILDCLSLCYFADGSGPPRGRHSVASELSVPGIDRDNSSVCHYMRQYVFYIKRALFRLQLTILALYFVKALFFLPVD